MKVAFIHYHLKTGGVTTVLKQQLKALPEHWSSVVVTGRAPEASFPARWIRIPQLAYSSQYKGRVDPVEVAGAILAAIRKSLKGPCDVLHVHNPILAKNHHFMQILKELQRKGANLLLQVHDFAEDGRPRAFFTEPYPANCHYCVLNRRDYDHLLKAGLTSKGLHLLGNSVPHPGRIPSPSADNPQPFTLYPVRAIRRKNIGEAILLSLFFNDRSTLSITLPPNSAEDIESYTGWKRFAKERHLPVEFERGLHSDFKTSVVSAVSLLTTSITEGFGFSFLEPWLYEKFLWGRKLPAICRDFEQKGILLPHLYSHLLVPVEWIGLRRFRTKWEDCVRLACGLFNYSIDDGSIQQSFDSVTRKGHIDFGLLDEGSQKKVLTHILGDRNKYDKMMQLNSFLANPGEMPGKEKIIHNNRKAIEKGYNPAQYARKLRQIYESVADTAVKHSIDKSVLISAFLDLENFSLLKWSDYAE